MTPSNTNLLYAACPILYQNKRGFDCGDGWFALLDELSVKLEVINNSSDNPKAIATQVKEKFGGLRFYVESGTDEIYALIDEAESASRHTCEECGEKGILRQGVWMRTLCDICNSKI